MATIIDSLIVELGLDPSKFSKGQRDAMDALRKLQEDADKFNKQAKAGFDVFELGFSRITTAALKFGGALLGARGIEELLKNLTLMNNELGRSAELIGVNQEELSKWQNIAHRSGGSADEMRETFGFITRSISQVNVTGPNTDFFQWLAKLGVNYRQFVDPKGQVNNMTGLLQAISGGMERLPPGERQLASQALGLGNQNTLLFGQGPARIQQMLKDQERINVITEQQTENSRKLVSQWRELEERIISAGNALQDHFNNTLSDTMESMNALMDVINNKGDRASQEHFWKPWTDPDSNHDPLFQFLRRLWGSIKGGGSRTEQFGPFLPPTEIVPKVKEGANLPFGLYAVAASLAGIPGFEVTGGKDAYHGRFGSLHNEGLALDFKIGNAANAAKLESMINAKFKEMGIDASAINEYDPMKRSGAWTGPHVHLGFRSQEALSKFNEARAAGKLDFHIENLNVRANDANQLATSVAGAPAVKSAVSNRSKATNQDAGAQ